MFWKLQISKDKYEHKVQIEMLSVSFTLRLHNSIFTSTSQHKMCRVDILIFEDRRPLTRGLTRLRNWRIQTKFEKYFIIAPKLIWKKKPEIYFAPLVTEAILSIQQLQEHPSYKVYRIFNKDLSQIMFF